MKIAVIVSTYPPYAGGMGNAARDAVAILQKAGHEVVVFTLGEGSGSEGNVVRLVPRLNFGFKNGGFVPQLYKKLAKGSVIASGTNPPAGGEVQRGNLENASSDGIASSSSASVPLRGNGQTPSRNDAAFDAIYLHYPFYGGAELVWLYALLHKKIKLVIQFHMDTPQLSRLGKMLMLPSAAIRKSLFARAQAVICSTLDYARHASIGSYVEQWPQKFIEIPFGVDLRAFHVYPYDVPMLQEMREHYGIGADEKVVMFLGGLDQAHSFKGVDVLLQALAKLNKRSTLTIRGLICGSGDMADAYKKQAQDLGIANKVIFTGRVSDEEKTLHYNLADVFVLPSTDSSEAFGIVLLEAMACGIPVVASDLPGVRAVFEDGVSGYTVEPGSAESLAEKLYDYFRHPQRRWKMGKAARDRAEERYDAEVVEEQLKKVFE